MFLSGEGHVRCVDLRHFCLTAPLSDRIQTHEASSVSCFDVRGGAEFCSLTTLKCVLAAVVRSEAADGTELIGDRFFPPD